MIFINISLICFGERENLLDMKRGRMGLLFSFLRDFLIVLFKVGILDIKLIKNL